MNPATLPNLIHICCASLRWFGVEAFPPSKAEQFAFVAMRRLRSIGTLCNRGKFGCAFIPHSVHRSQPSLLYLAVRYSHPPSVSSSVRTPGFTLQNTAIAQQTAQQKRKEEEEERQESQQQQRTQHNTSSQSSSNPFISFFHLCRRAFDWYIGHLDRHPIITQGLTSGFLFAIGDLTAQRYEVYLDASKGIDVSDRPYMEWGRLFACTAFGLFIMGPLGHLWYTWLDVFTNKFYPIRTPRNVLLKVLLDTAIFNPLFLIIFFSSVSLMEGLTIKDISYKLYRDFVPSYTVDCCIWPFIQVFNFRFVPVKFQLLIVNLGCYFDDIFLSYVQVRQGRHK